MPKLRSIEEFMNLREASRRIAADSEKTGARIIVGMGTCGIAAGATVAETVAKEAWEEAGLPAALERTARPAGTLEIRRAQPDGLQLETIFVHDLDLPDDTLPVNRDGEVAEFRLVTPEQAARLLANESGPDVVTADASLVVVDWLMRHGYVPRGTASWDTLDRLRQRESPR
jgi:hypothetical protein